MKPNGYQVIAEFYDCENSSALNEAGELSEIIKSSIIEAGARLVSGVNHDFQPGGATAIAIISESHVAIHTYPEAKHASVDVFTCSSLEKSERIISALRARLKPGRSKMMIISRGNPLEVTEKDWMPSFSNHGFEVSYHVEKILYSGRSKYQQIDVIKNEIFGEMLFLDRDLQIATKDAHVYNHYMTDLVIKKQCDRVAILGGGDGGILNKLIDAGIPEIFLVDIDQKVIDVSATYLEKINDNCFDHPSVNLVIDDANVFLKESRGDCFDAIIYDLTMHPEALTNNDREDFLNEIFNNVYWSMKIGALLQMQCCSEFDMQTLSILKPILGKYFNFMDFRPVYIPSFCEKWVFGSATNIPETHKPAF